MEPEELKVKESTIKCTMKTTTQKGKKYNYPQYSITLKKPYLFSKGEEVVVLAGEEVKKVFNIDKPRDLWKEIGNLKESKTRIMELEGELTKLQDKHTKELKELKTTHSTQLGNLTNDKELVENKLKHTKERLLKEQKDTQELEAILKEYKEANILTVWFNRRFKRLPELPSKTTAEDEEKGG